MDITFLGHSSFRLRGREAVIITDPFDPAMVGLKYPPQTADIVTISHDHGDHNRQDLVQGVRKVVTGPGEYEIMGVSIIGIASFHDDNDGGQRGKNTIFVFEQDGLRLAHLGDLGHEISAKTHEEMGEVDILMIPVGGEFTIGAAAAAKIVRDIEPRITLPMHYQVPGLNPDSFAKLTGVEDFIKELEMPVETTDKLSVKKELLGEEQKIVVLEKK